MHVLSLYLASVVVTSAILTSTGLYLLPVLVAWLRRVPDLGSVAVVNVLLGWTLVGWVAALAMALRSAPLPLPVVEIVQHLSGPPPGDRLRAGRPDLYPRREGTAPPLELPSRPAGPGTAS